MVLEAKARNGHYLYNNILQNNGHFEPSQSIATFTALQRRGIESQFLYFPDEGHSVSRPQNIVQWHKVVLDWFERCL